MNKGPKPLTFPAKNKERGMTTGGSRDPAPKPQQEREERVEGGQPTGDGDDGGGGPASRAPADHRGTTTEREMERKSERSSEAEG